MFLVLLKQIQKPSLNKSLDKYEQYYQETIIGLKNNIYSSYDQYINEKYKVEINYKTLEKLKNYFR